MAPIQYLLVGFDQPEIDRVFGGHLAGFRAASEMGLLRILSIRAAYKDVDGNVSVTRLSSLTEEEQLALGAVAGGLIGYGAAGEAGAEVGAEWGFERVMDGPGPLMQALRDEVIADMPNDSAAVLLLIEHKWIDTFVGNLNEAGGFVLASGFITAKGLMDIGAALAELSEEIDEE